MYRITPQQPPAGHHVFQQLSLPGTCSFKQLLSPDQGSLHFPVSALALISTKTFYPSIYLTCYLVSHIELPLKDSPKEFKVFCWKFIYLKATAKIYGYPVKSCASLLVWPQLSCWQVILLKISKAQCYFLDPVIAKWMQLSVLEFMYKYFTFLLNSLFPLSSNKKENGII